MRVPDAFPRCRIPNSNRAIATRRRKLSPVWAPCHGRHPARMSVQRDEILVAERQEAVPLPAAEIGLSKQRNVAIEHFV